MEHNEHNKFSTEGKEFHFIKTTYLFVLQLSFYRVEKEGS